MATSKSTQNSPDKDVENNKVVAGLSYIWILFLLPMLLKRDSKYCQFHAKQGLILFILSFLTWIPFFGWLLGLAIIIVSVIGIVKTLAGEWWKIPYIYQWSEKINL